MNSNLPYQLYWLDLNFLGYDRSIALGGLPGYSNPRTRNINNDKEVIVNAGITHIFNLCEDKELERFGVNNIFSTQYQSNTNDNDYDEMQIHHFPIEIGSMPSIEVNLEIIKEIFAIIERNEKCLIVSRNCYGRACLLGGSILLHAKDDLLYNQVYENLKFIVGPRAINTVKQYNYLVDFRSLRDDYNALTYEREYYLRQERNISR